MTLTLTERIIQDDGLDYDDLKLKTEADYEETVNYLIAGVKAWINRHTGVTYTNTTTYPTYPSDLELIVYNIVIRLLSNQTIQQDMPVVDNENFKILYAINKVITTDDREALKPFIRKINPRITVLGATTPEDDDSNNDVV